jgi:hypothetical protein
LPLCDSTLGGRARPTSGTLLLPPNSGKQSPSRAARRARRGPALTAGSRYTTSARAAEALPRTNRERQERDAERLSQLLVREVVGRLATRDEPFADLSEERCLVVCVHVATIARERRAHRRPNGGSCGRRAHRPVGPHDGPNDQPVGREGLDLHANMRSMGADDDDRLILAALAAAHPAMVELDALRAVDGAQYPDEAVRRLHDDGLVVRAGDLVGTRRTFRRAQALLTS